MYALAMSRQERPAPTPEQVAARIAEAARRANAEADERRAREIAVQLPPELGGPKGPEPTRYGDWERKGIVSDF
jgi:hypothetical protein